MALYKCRIIIIIIIIIKNLFYQPFLVLADFTHHRPGLERPESYYKE